MTTPLHDKLRESVGLDKLMEAAETDELARKAAALEEHEDAPESDDDRYAVYAVKGTAHRRMAETSLEGIGLTLKTLRAEVEYDQHDSIGILDRLERTWLVNPWARG